MIGRGSATRTVTWIVLFFFALGSVAIGVHNALSRSQDLEWQPSRMLLSGKAPAHLYLESKAGTGEPYPLMEAQVPNYEPSGLVFLWPIAALPWKVAKPVWAFLNLSFTFGILVLLRRRLLNTLGLAGIAAVGMLLLAGTPFRNTMGNGQNGIFVLFCFLLALEAMEKKRLSLAGVALAASWLKYTLTFPLSIAFLKRNRVRVAVVAAGIHVILTVALTFWTGASPIDLVLDPLRAGGQYVAEGSIDVFGLSAGLSESPLIPGAIAIAILVATAYSVLRNTQGDELFLLSVLSLLASIVVYHRAYDQVVFVFPLAYVIRSMAEGRARRSMIDRLILALFGLAIAISFYELRIVEAAAAAWPNSGTLSALVASRSLLVLAAYAALGCCLFKLNMGSISPRSTQAESPHARLDAH